MQSELIPCIPQWNWWSSQWTLLRTHITCQTCHVNKMLWIYIYFITSLFHQVNMYSCWTLYEGSWHRQQLCICTNWIIYLSLPCRQSDFLCKFTSFSVPFWTLPRLFHSCPIIDFMLSCFSVLISGYYGGI